MKFNQKVENYNFSDSSGLKFLEWQMPTQKFDLEGRPQKFEITTGNEFENLIQYLKQQDSNFFLFGDSSILYGLIKKPSINPSILWQYGYGMPEKNSPEINNYQLKVIENIKKYDVKIFIQEGTITWMNLKLGDFPIIENFLKLNKCNSNVKIYGAFKVYPICYQKL
jgi:hypothetical protein